MEVARLSVDSRRARARFKAARPSLGALPVWVEAGDHGAVAELVRRELSAPSLVDSFALRPLALPERGPWVRVRALEALDCDLELCAAVGESDSARQRVFQLVQSLVAASMRVRVRFVERAPRATFEP
ncbi:MAG: hypothetical protein QM756_01260 [Polyangiaceae bacterium]